MPLCHFAFGGLHRKGKHLEQADAFIDNILVPKKLRSFVCPEFLPLINKPGGMAGDPSSARITADGAITMDRWVPTPPVSLLPSDVWMICFVDIALNKLRHWEPADHYGRLGVAFTEKFRRRAGVKGVSYYANFANLNTDPIVVSYNRAVQIQDKPGIERLHKLLVGRRKPARLWPELNGLFSMLHVTGGGGASGAFQHLTYSRYPEGYDFTSEREARIVTTKDQRDVMFEEGDVLAVLAPNQQTQAMLKTRLQLEWKVPPEILLFPA